MSRAYAGPGTRRARPGPSAEWRAERDWYVHELVRAGIAAGLLHEHACELAGREHGISEGRAGAIDTKARRSSVGLGFDLGFDLPPARQLDCSRFEFPIDAGIAIAVLERHVDTTRDVEWRRRAQAMLAKVRGAENTQ